MNQRARTYFGAKIIPARGAWVEIESEADGVIYVKIDRKTKVPDFITSSCAWCYETTKT